MYKDSVIEEVRGCVERWAGEKGANLDTEGLRKCKRVGSVLHPLSAPGGEVPESFNLILLAVGSHGRYYRKW